MSKNIQSETTQEERLTDKFLRQCNAWAVYWAKVPNITALERTTGVVHSILSTLDGGTAGIPMMNLVPCRSDDPEAELPSIFGMEMDPKTFDVKFTNQETLDPATVIRSGSLHDAFGRIRRELADKLAD